MWNNQNADFSPTITNEKYIIVIITSAILTRMNDFYEEGKAFFSIHTNELSTAVPDKRSLFDLFINSIDYLLSEKQFYDCIEYSFKKMFFSLLSNNNKKSIHRIYEKQIRKRYNDRSHTHTHKETYLTRT